MPTSGLSGLMQQLRLPADFMLTVDSVYRPVASEIAGRRASVDHTIVVGINGCQGSGKSTLASFLKCILKQENGIWAEILSMDDLYFPRDVRLDLGDTVHPLLCTRGVPGTHDIGLGGDVVRQLCEAADTTETPIPGFDKATDDRVSRADWRAVTGRPDIILLEGWCVGVTPQEEAELVEAINSLEAERDPERIWRRWVNEQTAGLYARFFQCVDCLVVLQAPSFEVVFDWRCQQEERLREAVDQWQDCAGIMSDAELREFIMHYERLTRHMLRSLPQQADILVELAADRSPGRVLIECGMESL